MAFSDDGDLLPLRAGFDSVWRGFHRGQVEEFLGRVETELKLVVADRDEAVSQARDVSEQLEVARSEVSQLKAKVDRLCTEPISPDALDERLRRRLELAEAEAAEITERAQ